MAREEAVATLCGLLDRWEEEDEEECGPTESAFSSSSCRGSHVGGIFDNRAASCKRTSS